MPPPSSRIQRPAVKKPALQRGSTVGNTTSLTSTDTWNKPTSNLQISAPSTKSTVPGVDLKRGNAEVRPKLSQGFSGTTPKPSSVGSGRKNVPKPLPGAKLRPLQANDRENDRSANTWDPKNRPNILKNQSLKGSTVSLKATKVKLNGPSSATTPSSAQADDASPSRSSSVASNKPVLPDIKKAQNSRPSSVTVTSLEKPADKDVLTASPSQVRPQTSRKRETAAAKLKKAVAEETKQADEYTDYYIPEWYKSPLIKPAVLKGGITVFCTTMPSKDKISSQPEFVNYLCLQSMRNLKDVRRLMTNHVNQALLTLTYFIPTDVEESQNGANYIPPSLSKTLALKANSLTSKPFYRESVNDPEVYHLISCNDEPEDEDVEKILESIDFVGYCTEIAESLGVKSVTTVEEIDVMIVKSMKRHANVQKQERALHPHIYLQPFESDDVWNHVNLSHKVAESCFRRQSLCDEVKAAITSDVRAVSSPIIISGSKKVGKTWLCAQIPSLMGEEVMTVVRFCGMTRLTTTLPKVLRGVSKQLHVIYHSLILPRTIEQSSIRDISELFTDMLKQVSEAAKKPVVLVLDAFDKLAASCDDLSQFVALCRDSVPANIALVISTTCEEGEDTEFYDHFRDVKSDLVETINDEILELGGAVDLSDYDEYKSLEALEENSALFGIDMKAHQERSARIEELNTQWNEAPKGETKLALSKMLELKKQNYEFLSETLKTMVNAKIDLSEIDEDKRIDFSTNFESLKESINILEKSRSDTRKALENKIKKFEELYPNDELELDNLGHRVCASQSANTQRHIKLSNFTTEESIEFIKYLSHDKLDGAECEKLCKVASYVHNPLLLRLIVNRCSLSLPADVIVTAFDAVLNTPLRDVFYAKVTSVDGDKSTSKKPNAEVNSTVDPHGLVHIVTSLLIFSKEIKEKGGSFNFADSFSDDGDEGMGVCETALTRDVSALRLTDAEIKYIVGDVPAVESVSDLIDYLNQVLDGCALTVYEQNDYARDVEHIESLLRSEFIKPRSSRYVSRLFLPEHDMKHTVVKILKHVFQTCASFAMWSNFSMTDEENPHTLIEFADGFAKSIFQRLHNGDAEGPDDCRHSMLKNMLSSLYSAARVSHESDTWQEVADVIVSQEPKKQSTNLLAALDTANQTPGPKKAVAESTRDPVTSAKEKKYPVGRKKVMALGLIERVVAADVYRDSGLDPDEPDPNHDMVELLLLYDFLMPLLHDFGVDYVTDAYGNILELITNSLELHGRGTQNLLALEMLYNLLVIYTRQLRENPANFYTLFLSMFNEDSALTSRAAFRLYKRVMHEVDVRNNLHIITMLSKTIDLPLLSQDTKRYLLNTSNKYAASQCISNASYILSHNNKHEVKLWELTGEFISVQTFHGRIVCVCPQRAEQCFLAVLETVSEVGQKSASVWRIDRLTHKKLADVGSRTIIYAWFDALGQKLVMVEQNSPDEIRVVMCTPQTMELTLKENTISITPHQRSGFMDKCLGIPTKVDGELLEIMKKHLTDDKKDADPTELSLFKPIAGHNSHALDLVVANYYPLILSSLESIWEDLLEKYDAKDDIIYPMEEIRSEVLQTKESVHKMSITLHGMTSAGDIVVDCQFSDGTHNVLLYKLSGDSISLNNELSMDEQATMTLMPTDDFVYSDTGSNSGLTSWNLPTNEKKIFGNEKKVHVTCLQYEVEEGQILSFTRGQVTVWNARQKTTESSFTLDKAADVVAACLQDNWLAIANREGELTIRFEIRKKMASYHFYEPIDWIDCHVIGDYLYVACHLNGEKPSICFLKYRVSDAPLDEPEKYVVRSSMI